MSKPNVTEDIAECGGIEWLVMTIASNDLFDFDKLFEMMDEAIVSPLKLRQDRKEPMDFDQNNLMKQKHRESMPRMSRWKWQKKLW